MYRSASTWSYNVCLEILESQGRSVVGAHSPSFAETLSGMADPSADLVFKAHSLDTLSLQMISQGDGKAVYTHRNPLDAIASGITFLNISFEQMFEFMADSVRTLEQLQHLQRGLFISYEEIMADAVCQITDMAAYLEQSLTAAQTAAIAEHNAFAAVKAFVDRFDTLPEERIFRAPANWAYDRRTLLHRNHLQGGRSGRGAEQLGPERGRLVRDAFGRTFQSLRPDFAGERQVP